VAFMSFETTRRKMPAAIHYRSLKKEIVRACWKSFAKCQDDEMQVRMTDTLHGDRLKSAQFIVLELLSCKMATISHFVISSMTLFQIPRGRCIRASTYPNVQLTRKNITYII